MNTDQYERWAGMLTPRWMISLDERDKEDVMTWLKKHGVNPDECAGVVVAGLGGSAFRARMYAVDSQGRAEFRDGQVQYQDDITFSPTYLPEVVVERLRKVNPPKS